jgi:hypothetical protein
MLPIYSRYNFYSSSSNFRNSSLFTDIHNNFPTGRGVSGANHVCKDVNIFRKHVTSLKQILHYSVTFSINLPMFSQGFGFLPLYFNYIAFILPWCFCFVCLVFCFCVFVLFLCCISIFVLAL